MGTKITDLAILGTSTAAGFTGLAHSYGSFAVTAGGAILLAIIRWQQHKQTMRHRDELHRAQLRKLDQNPNK